MKKLMTGNEAAAWGARLAEVDYIPNFPITPQTEIIETLSRWVREGKMKAIFRTMDSEHSMVTAAGSASATGARVFTATSSQGLLYAFEMLYNLSGWRVPVVMVNVSRGLSAPITLEPDHNDVLSARDSGFLQIHCETAQEILDSILMAYRISENKRVMLPTIVNFDGFYLSFTREIVDIPELENVRKFLPEYNPTHAFFKASKPLAQGTPVLNSSLYSYFRYQVHKAMENALEVYKEAKKEFSRTFGRSVDEVEAYMMDDADYAILMTNSFSTKGKKAVMKMREKKIKVGLIKLRLFRPFPAKEVMKLVKGLKGLAIVDQNISPGKGGVIYSEVSSELYNYEERPRVITSFIGGLGGKNISESEFEYIVNYTRRAYEERIEPKIPILLFTEEDRKVSKMLIDIAHRGEGNEV
ncbi:MAG: pyruvate synthase [Thermoproteota archaeon]